jgi:uncharacterized protein YbjT (DUF2867 family)
MPRSDRLLAVVAGASGKTGRAVAGGLEAAGWATRRLTREHGDLGDPATLLAATEGADALYHLAPNLSAAEEPMGANALAAARRHGLRLVFHSVLAPSIEAMPHHWRKARVEAMLHAAPDVAWTILQPAPYLQNLLPFLAEAAEHGRFRLPYDPAMPLAMVDLADVAETAAIVLADDAHIHASWELCGEAGVTHLDVATRIGTTVERVAPDDWPGAPDDLVAMFRFYDAAGLTGSTQALETLLGHPPTSLDRFLSRVEIGRGVGAGPSPDRGAGQ